MGTPVEGATIVDYCGGQDITVWLERLNDVDPVVYPHWPREYPDRLAVCLGWQEGREGVPYDLLVPTSRRQMLNERGPGRLWFCNVPCDEFCAETSAELAWFN